MAFGKRLRLLLLLATLSAGATMRIGAQGIYAETVWESGTVLEAGRIREAGKVREAGVQRGYPAAAGWEYMLSPGRAVMEGRIRNVRTGMPPKTFTVRVEDIFGDEERNVLVQPDGEGNFRVEVPLPYPQFVYVDDVDYVFLFPGDTLRCELYADGGRRMAAGSDRQVFAGDNTSAEVNRKWREIEPRYFWGIAMPHEVYRKDKAEVFAYRDTLLRIIDGMEGGMERERMKEQRTTEERGTLEERKMLPEKWGRSEERETTRKWGTPAEWEVESPVVADILKTLVVEGAFRRMVEAANGYCDRFRGQEEGTYDALDEGEFFSFLKERRELLLDNPLMLMTSTQWVLFNRLEFGVYKGIYFYASRLARPLPPNLPEAVARYVGRYVLPREYDKGFLREALPWRGDTLFTKRHYYGEVLKELKEQYGVGNTFMFQALLVRSVFVQESNGPELPPDVYAAEMEGILPFLTHPVVCRKAVERYREYVIRHEGGGVANAATPEADSILRRITAPYAGNVLYLDFWGIGCGPCRTGILNQREIVKEMRRRPVRFLYLCQDERAVAEEFMRKNNIRGEHIFLTRDEWNHLSAKFNFSAIPFKVIIDRQGNIHPHSAEVPSREELEKFINP